MANPTTKQDLKAAIQDGYDKLQQQIAKMTSAEISTPFNFESDPKKCGVRWQYDRCLRDILNHIYEWQVLMQQFVQNIREGQHQQTSLDEANRLLDETHEEMLRLADSFTEEELFTKGFYKCTYTTRMAAYFASVTTSPYSQAIKLLKSHQKQLAKGKK